MDGIVHLLLWQVLGVPVVTDPMHAPIERITFSVSLEGGGAVEVAVFSTAAASATATAAEEALRCGSAA